MNWDKARRDEIVRERGPADPARPHSGGVRTSADGFALILSKYGGTCAACGKQIVKGRRMKWRSADKTMLHTSCTIAGSSTSATHEPVGRGDPDRYRDEIDRRRKAAEGFIPANQRGQQSTPGLDRVQPGWDQGKAVKRSRRDGPSPVS